MATNQTTVIIVGAGPSGLSTAACLSNFSIPYIILEREDYFASIWNKYSYDRLHLHLAKQYCQLPLMPFPANYPTFVPKSEFLNYLDEYVSHFGIKPRCNRRVDSAKFGHSRDASKWEVVAKNLSSGEMEEYSSDFLIVATGETSDAYIPKVEGLDNFAGDVIHSTLYKNGKPYKNKSVLVVGCGNSGMEIALDLANHGAKTSIVIRSPLHILSRWTVHLGLVLREYIPLSMLDSMLMMLSKLIFGDLTKYGIRRPDEGPFSLKVTHGIYPVIDVGTCNKIKSGEIQVLPAISRAGGNEVAFHDGKSYPFDSIVFATGFRNSTKHWLKGDKYLLNDDGLPKQTFPNHWKGENGLYCAGLCGKGLIGAAFDAVKIADDIKKLVHSP